jgi:hypothetical protein
VFANGAAANETAVIVKPGTGANRQAIWDTLMLEFDTAFCAYAWSIPAGVRIAFSSG